MYRSSFPESHCYDLGIANAILGAGQNFPKAGVTFEGYMRFASIGFNISFCGEASEFAYKLGECSYIISGGVIAGSCLCLSFQFVPRLLNARFFLMREMIL